MKIVNVGQEKVFFRILRISAPTPLVIESGKMLRFNFVVVIKLYPYTEFERSAVDGFRGQGHLTYSLVHHLSAFGGLPFGNYER